MGRHLLARGGLDLSLNFDPKHTPKSTNINLQTPKPRAASNLLPAYPFAAALQLVTARGSVS
jgi:hypothetical protein